MKFPIKLLEAELEEVPDGISYFAAKGGVFKTVSNPLYTAVLKTDECPLCELKEDLVLHVPKLPLGLLRQVEANFQAVYDQHKAEAAELLLYKPGDGWRACHPPQTIKPGCLEVDYETDFESADPKHNLRLLLTQGWLLFGTIHSHAGASAFQSGQDKHNEEHRDGLHITVGSFNSPERSYHCRWVIQGVEFKSELGDCVEGESLPADPAFMAQVSLPAAQPTWGMFDPFFQTPTEALAQETQDWPMTPEEREWVEMESDPRFWEVRQAWNNLNV